MQAGQVKFYTEVRKMAAMAVQLNDCYQEQVVEDNYDRLSTDTPLAIDHIKDIQTTLKSRWDNGNRDYNNVCSICTDITVITHTTDRKAETAPFCSFSEWDWCCILSPLQQRPLGDPLSPPLPLTMTPAQQSKVRSQPRC